MQKPYPPLWFGGSSPAGIEVAARHVDTYLTWAEPPAQVAEKLALVRSRAAAHGRRVEFGLRVHLIVRETDEEAWDTAHRLISHLSDETIAAAQKRMRRIRIPSGSFGNRTCTAAVATSWRSARTCGPASAWSARVSAWRWWAARTPSRRGCASTRRWVYATVIASAYPHLEEAYRVAELLFPALGIGRQAG